MVCRKSKILRYLVLHQILWVVFQEKLRRIESMIGSTVGFVLRSSQHGVMQNIYSGDADVQISRSSDTHLHV